MKRNWNYVEYLLSSQASNLLKKYVQTSNIQCKYWKVALYVLDKLDVQYVQCSYIVSTVRDPSLHHPSSKHCIIQRRWCLLAFYSSKSDYYLDSLHQKVQSASFVLLRTRKSAVISICRQILVEEQKVVETKYKFYI